jgi:glycosyltransferase involved in cell wall biosynthesis
MAPPTTVTAVIPTYNRAEFLPEAIASILSQTRPVDEIIVIDDGSSDDTEAVLARYPEVRLIRQENQGAAAARNRGIEAARSEWIAFLDSDDLWRPNKIEEQLRAAARHPDATLIYGSFIVTSFRGGAAKLISPPRPDQLKEAARFYNPFPPSVVIARKGALLEVGGFREDLQASCEDWELFFRMTRRFPMAAVDMPLLEYRETAGSISLQASVMLPATLSILETLLDGVSGPRRMVYSRRIKSTMLHHAAVGQHDLGLILRSVAEWPLGNSRRYKSILLYLARTLGKHLRG